MNVIHISEKFAISVKTMFPPAKSVMLLIILLTARYIINHT